MANASITTLGIGSGLELQSIIDQLRDVDKAATITPKENKVADLEKQLDEFTVVKNKLLSMKSNALDLSLNSTFLGRTVSSSDEDVFTASVVDSATVQTSSIDVDRLATKSSWTSGGTSATSDIIYVPTSQESTTGVADAAVDVVMLEGESMTITYGNNDPADTITITAPAGGWTMDDIVNELNVVSVENDAGAGANGKFVWAETYTVDSEDFLRIKTDTVGGSGEAHRVAISEDLTNLDFSPPTEVFQYEVGPVGDTTVVTLNVAADTTLSGLVTLINDDTDNPGITASAIDDGSATDPYKLLLQADTTGENYRINITDQLPDITFTEQQGASAESLNSQVTIDSISYERQTNSISDIITGVTLALESVSTSTLTIGYDNDSIATLIKDLVTNYNDAVQEIKSNTDWDEDTEEFGVLASTTLRDLPYELQSLLTSTIRADSGGNITTIFDLGFEFEADGTVSIDEDALDTALSTYGSGVQSFFVGDSANDIEGLADKLNARLRTITSDTGQIGGERTSANIRIDELELQIESATERLDKKYEIMTKQFIALDQYMSKMTSLSNFLTSQFDSLNNLLSGRSGKK